MEEIKNDEKIDEIETQYKNFFNLNEKFIFYIK